MNTYLIGQFVMFILANLIFSWWATVHKKPALSAIALIGTTIRPEGVILTGAMLFDLLLARHFKTVAIWAGILGGLLALSFLQLGWWVDDMLDVVQVYRDCCTYTNAASEVPGGRVGEIVMILVVIVWAAWMLLRMRHLPDLTRIPWSLSTVIVATLLVSTQSKDYTLIYLLIPLWVSLWSTRGHWLSSLAVLAIMASSWVFWRMKLTVNDGDPKEQLLMPIFAGIVLTIHWLIWSKAKVAASSEPGLPETLPAA
jgi:hypothetical protein